MTSARSASRISVQDLDPTVDVQMSCVKAPWKSLSATPIRIRSTGLPPVPSMYDATRSAYCVPEWQIVDLVKRFAASLDRTPWFHFLFIATMNDVRRSFWHSARAVAEREGVSHALTSNGFAVGAVISVA
ncbi:FAD-binding PCMH-type domain-containing protein [Plasmodiophora brassicae]